MILASAEHNTYLGRLSLEKLKSNEIINNDLTFL